MKIKLVGYKSRFIPDYNLTFYRGDEKEVTKELGENLLQHNTKDRIIWEEVKSKKKGAE
jgi:hypothetical protein